MRNIEVLKNYFLGKDPQLKETLSDNSLRLIGIEGKYFVQRKELIASLKALQDGIKKAMKDMEGDIYVDIDLVDEGLKAELNELDGELGDLAKELEDHEKDNVKHLTQDQINRINNAVTKAELTLEVARQLDSALPEVTREATVVANQYTDKVKEDLEKQIGELNVPKIIDPETGEEIDQPISEALEVNPQRVINPEYFNRFKNMIDNSSFEVFDGTTMIPLGWDNGTASEDASMFHSHSLKLTSGQITKQTPQHQADVTWMKGAYDTNDVMLCFYHKFDSVGVKVYDMVNEQYLTLTAIDTNLSELGTSEEIVYPYATNWNQYRCMVKFTPLSSTRKVRVEFNCKTGGEKGECYIDAPSMEPYIAGEYPSIYKDGRYSGSTYQLLNPPPTDVDRFTPLEHLNVANSVADSNGQIYYQEMTRINGTLAIKREASNPDTNGFYQTFVETFYKKDGVTVNYVDTYSYTYTDTGAILTKSKTTTEVM